MSNHANRRRRSPTDPALIARSLAGQAALALLASPAPATDGALTLRRFHLPWDLAVRLHAVAIETLVDAGRDDLINHGAVGALSGALTGAPDVEVPGDAAVALGAFCTAFARCDPLLAELSPDMDPALGRPAVESVTTVTR